MRKSIFCILIVLLTLPVFAQRQAQAKVVLDETATAFEKAGGVKAVFNVQVFNKERLLGESTGTILLRGEKFLLKTAAVVTWFDGRTQWSYLAGNDEVNISVPTPDELQRMNPYALLYLYRNGFSYKMGADKTIRGKQVYEVVLTATNKKLEMARIVLCVAKDTYQPVSIIVESRDKSKSKIMVTGYQTGLKYNDSMFVFDKKQYPNAEMIDLR